MRHARQTTRSFRPAIRAGTGLVLVVLLVLTTVRAGFADPPVPSPSPAGDFSNYPPDIASILKKGELVIGMVKTDEPPFFMTDASGNLSGSDVELGRMIARQLGVKPVFDRSADTYNQVIDEVFQHRVDIGLGLLSITARRAVQVSFTEDYYKFNPSLLVNRLLLAKYEWQQNALQKMARGGADIKIGALRDSANLDAVKTGFPGATIVEYDDWRTALQDVVDGKLFAAMTPCPLSLQNWIFTHVTSKLKSVEVTDPLKVESIGIAVPWQSPNLRYLLTLCINELRNNGKLATWRNEAPVKQ